MLNQPDSPCYLELDLASGPPSPELPANILRPSAIVTDRAFIVGVPSLARNPSMVTSSPAFKLVFLQPCR